MRTLQIRRVTETDLASIANDILAASRADRVVKLDFVDATAYLDFSSGMLSAEIIGRVPELSKVFGPHVPTNHAHSRLAAYNYVVESLLEAQGAGPFCRETYDTGQVIYRFK